MPDGLVFNATSEKQIALMGWWASPSWRDKDGIIAYGSVRSGKTVCGSIGFCVWAMTNFDERNFAICGKTVGSTRRNVIAPLMQTLPTFGIMVDYHRSENLIVMQAMGHTNRFYLFGGNDERSADLIQGITLAGIFFDEVTLQPRSFVNQGMARCSIAGSKIWMTCNPESPAHWVKTDFVDKAQERRMLVIHFTMDDNPSLTDAVKERYKRSFFGVFYNRYILGLWSVSEGLVYPDFSTEENVIDFSKEDLFDGTGRFDSARYAYPMISLDYGTANPTAALLIVWSVERKRFIVVDEFYYDGHNREQIDDIQKYEAVKKLALGIPLYAIIVDPSALSFITHIKNRREFRVLGAVNDVLSGIALTQTMIDERKYLVSKSCKGLLSEFGLYVWDDKAQGRGEDKPLKTHDHALDALRYHAMTFVRPRLKAFGILAYLRDVELRQGALV